MLFKFPKNARRFTKRDKNFKQSVLIYSQVSTVLVSVVNLSQFGCILDVFCVLVYTCALYSQ